MTVLEYILLGFLLICAIAANLSKNLLNAVLIFRRQRQMCIRDRVTSVLFFLTLRKVHQLRGTRDE